jgi:uncharacterized protein with PIN domain
MNNKDEVEYLNKARARAEYLATAKKRLETAPVDELLMLVRKGSGEIAMLAGEEITNRIERRLTKRAADFADCHVCGIAYPSTATICTKCGGKLQSR